MPAWPEEYEEAVEDDVEIHVPCNNPEQFNADGTPLVRTMKLGEPDESGCRRPVATLHTDETVTLENRQRDHRYQRTAGLRKSWSQIGVPMGEDGWLAVKRQQRRKPPAPMCSRIGDVQMARPLSAAIGDAGQRRGCAILERAKISLLTTATNTGSMRGIRAGDITDRKGAIAADGGYSNDREACS